MIASPRLLCLLLAAALPLPTPVAACGEGMFNTGKALPYQAYRAPRPAAVLVYAGAERENPALYDGLVNAGHRITLVRDPQALRSAMTGHRYQVVIAPLAGIDEVAAAEGEAAPALLPVVERALRHSAEVKNRFELFLLDGASLGQYLRAIDKLVKNH